MKKTVRSIIENVKFFHHGLSQYFSSIKIKAVNARAEMLLDYLSRREELSAEYLEEYLDKSKDRVLDRWVGVAPWLPCDIFASCVKDFDHLAPLLMDDVLDIAIHYDDCLIDFFRTLVRETEFSNAEPLFRNLLGKARKEEKNLAKDVLWFSDM